VSTGELPTTPGPEAAAKGMSLDVAREVRFAVVMYGGVSLAIYINGVTQELLNMVRATARSVSDAEKMLLATNELVGSEAVYREVAKRLDERCGISPAITDRTKELTRTRFVVDVISGTSAGGINGVFLAKALARNQRMKGLKTLWLTEGDLSKLLNDTKAEDYSSDSGFGVQKPEKSLLNSQRMYRKLLEALEQMEEQPNSDEDSPLVSELDLFITTTDIQGIPLPIQLADGVVYERRYRNVFHFRYAPDPRPQQMRGKKREDLSRDDFKKADDPFLAFAARCTSSFPFAFDAMQLDDIKIILDRYSRYGRDDPREGARWDSFFKDYLRLGLFDVDKRARGQDAVGLSVSPDAATAELRKAFRTRSFGDGGYLDNKPFSYATSMLMRRHSDCVVARKLLYVEPTPEHPELAPSQPRPRPDFAENVRSAALDLPRQETIREDMERLYERNAVLERTATFARNVDEDLRLVAPPTPMDHEQFRTADLKKMMSIYGVNYGAYHRLKIQEITELLTDLISAALGHDPKSDAAVAIGELVLEWRRLNYGELKENRLPKTENEFLLEFDVRYCLRRMSFLNRRVNQLAQLEKPGLLDISAEALLHAWLQHLEASLKRETKGDTVKVNEDVDLKKVQSLSRWVKPPVDRGAARNPDDKPPPDWVNDFCAELNRIKRELLGPGVIGARIAEESFSHPDSDAAQTLRAQTDKLNLPWEEMEPILSEDQEVKRNAITALLTDDRAKAFESVADVLRQTLGDRSFASLDIAQPDDVDPTHGRVAARLCLDHYYRNFVLYDLITYPVQYGTGAGEANVVEVYRVSPEDATSLINERHTGERRRKLAGRAVMSFGAFLDQRWRKNDMLWGRLDGAERLITILLPGRDKENQDLRKNLIKEAHLEILKEEVNADDLDELCKVISQALAECDPESDHARTLRAFAERLPANKDLPAVMNSALRRCFETPEDIWRYYREKYEVDRQLDPEHAVRLISRSTAIAGKMLEGLADKYRFDSGKRVASWIARLGTTFWNMIAVAVPQSLGNLFFQHWLGLSYLFAFTMIVVGIFVNANVKIAGWELLCIVVALHVVVSGLGNFMTGRRRLLTALRVVIILALMTLIFLGTQSLAQSLFGLGTEGQLILSAIVAVVLLCAVSIPSAIAAIGRWIAFKQRE
jgi:patatin-related protein